MKKIKTLSIFLMLLSAVTFTSCDTEPVDPVLNENNPENPNPENPDPENPGPSSGDYFPMAINNQWVFSDGGELMDPMKITSTATVSGTMYYKVNQFFTNAGTDGLTGTAEMLLRKNGSDYSVRVSVNIPEEEGIEINVSPYEFIFLKDNLNVGQTWTQDVTQTTSYNMPGMPVQLPPTVMDIHFTGTILEKDATVEVNGETYTNVIKVKLVQQTEATDLFPSITTTTTMWLAKDIGPVRSQSQADGVNTDQILESYDLN